MKRLAAVPIIFLAGCSSPTRPDIPPPPPQPQTVQVFDGWTDAHVSTLTARNGETVQVEQAGYLTRRQAFDGQPVFLWPATHQEAVQELVYTTSPLRRWTRPLVGVVLQEPGLEDHVDAALGPLSGLTGVHFRRQAQGEITLRVQEDHPRWAEGDAVAFAAWRWTQGYALYEVDIVFMSRDVMVSSRNTLLHELGHAIGLDHTTLPGAVMNVKRGRTTGFSEVETETIHMAYFHRQAGNLPPDSEPGADAAVMSAGSDVVVCQ